MAAGFKKELRKWRGKRLQKEAADLIGVALRTYQAWEQGAHEPPAWKCLECVQQKMKDHPE